jgi:hypothetical protein
LGVVVLSVVPAEKDELDVALHENSYYSNYLICFQMTGVLNGRFEGGGSYSSPFLTVKICLL